MPSPPSLMLQPHPFGADVPPLSVSASVQRGRDGSLRLGFTLRGAIARIRIPPSGPAGTADGLWAHTCCEAFIGAGGSSAYREFNFSPSGQWAIYDFADYRERTPSPAPFTAPAITLQCDEQSLQLEARIDAATIPAATVLQLGLAVVVETRAGALSYWALRHPGARPDFHHRDAFTLTLSPAPA